MDTALVYNTGDAPLLVDANGRTLGGGEHGLVYTGQPDVRAALDAGLLLAIGDTDKPPPDERTTVSELRQHRPKIEARRAALARRTRGALRRLAEEYGLPSEQTDANLAAALALDPRVEVKLDERPVPRRTQEA